MAWRGPRTPSNPVYSSRAWAKVKKHWITLGLTRCQARRCLLPGIPIDYTSPRTKPNSFNCGHIVSVRKGRALGWTLEQIWCLTNSRPEHRKCNVSDGAREGQRAQRTKQAAMAGRVDTSRRW